VGDIAYYSPLSTISGSGFETVTTGNVNKIGIVSSIDKLTNQVGIMVDANQQGMPINSTPNIGDYIMFEKDKRVNSSSLIGYYADVNFKNYSQEKIELFSIGSEVVESSK
jgi:hypothetical protein